MLSTIGYEGASLTDFIRTLKLAKIDILIDVRERAQSRRPGFSKTALDDALYDADIEYIHFRELGDPKEGRIAARAGNINEFKRIYANVMRRKDALAAIAEIVELSKSLNACLLCFERDHLACHRKIIADRIEKTSGIITTHLGVKHFESPKSSKRRVLHSGEGAAAPI